MREAETGQNESQANKGPASGRRLLPAAVCAILMVACATVKERTVFIPTALYGLEASYYPLKIPKPAASGGGIALIDDQALLVTGEGDFHLFRWNEASGEFELRALPYRVPINREAFVAEHGVNWESFRFRVSGLLLRPRGDSVEILTAHHYWNASKRCYVIRVSARSDQLDEFLAGASSGVWNTLYETTPCLPLREGGRGHAFGGQQQGGRMVWLDADNLLLTVGDHEYDGWNGTEQLPQDPDASYGKIIAIDRRSGESRVFSLGHRNPQGLYIDPAGAIWSTEHGPQGGDELNRIVPGANYGWPLETFGTEYGASVWPMSDQQGRHDRYESPVYAWVPSVGISNLVGVQKDIFPAWKGDLLISSLVGETLHRVRFHEGRPVFVEPIPIGKRIRDVIEASDGSIILWTDDASLVTLRPASESKSGELLFASRCMGCHRAQNEAADGIGPNLWRVAGRRVASEEGFRYSEAMEAVGGRWTDERLDAFIANPGAFMPGTAMNMEGVPEPAMRAAIVEHLGTLR